MPVDLMSTPNIIDLACGARLEAMRNSLSIACVGRGLSPAREGRPRAWAVIPEIGAYLEPHPPNDTVFVNSSEGPRLPSPSPSGVVLVTLTMSRGEA